MPFTNPEANEEQCKHPEHEPPNLKVLPKGIHTWQCPSCLEEKQVIVL